MPMGPQARSAAGSLQAGEHLQSVHSKYFSCALLQHCAMGQLAKMLPGFPTQPPPCMAC